MPQRKYVPWTHLNMPSKSANKAAMASAVIGENKDPFLKSVNATPTDAKDGIIRGKAAARPLANALLERLVDAYAMSATRDKISDTHQDMIDAYNNHKKTLMKGTVAQLDADFFKKAHAYDLTIENKPRGAPGWTPTGSATADKESAALLGSGGASKGGTGSAEAKEGAGVNTGRSSPKASGTPKGSGGASKGGTGSAEAKERAGVNTGRSSPKASGTPKGSGGASKGGTGSAEERKMAAKAKAAAAAEAEALLFLQEAQATADAQTAAAAAAAAAAKADAAAAEEGNNQVAIRPISKSTMKEIDKYKGLADKIKELKDTENELRRRLEEEGAELADWEGEGRTWQELKTMTQASGPKVRAAAWKKMEESPDQGSYFQAIKVLKGHTDNYEQISTDMERLVQLRQNELVDFQDAVLQGYMAKIQTVREHSKTRTADTGFWTNLAKAVGVVQDDETKLLKLCAGAQNMFNVFMTASDSKERDKAYKDLKAIFLDIAVDDATLEGAYHGSIPTNKGPTNKGPTNKPPITTTTPLAVGQVYGRGISPHVGPLLHEVLLAEEARRRKRRSSSSKAKANAKPKRKTSRKTSTTSKKRTRKTTR